jgi:hypothetical protein
MTGYVYGNSGLNKPGHKRRLKYMRALIAFVGMYKLEHNGALPTEAEVQAKVEELTKLYIKEKR